MSTGRGDTLRPRLYFAAPALWPAYREPLTRALAEAGIAAELSDTAPDPEAVDYIVYAPGGPVTDFSPFRNARAVLSLWAGVERIVGNPTLTMPLCRMVDPSLTQGMVEYVVGHALRFHLGMDRYRQDGVWRNALVPPIAAERPVTVLGLGELGAACATALAGLGFPVTGWSRSPKAVEGITCLSGEDALPEALARAQILVTLLPATPATDRLMNADRLARLPEGACLINPGRGSLIDDAALIAALDGGRLAHAVLDVFRIEPLPPEHPFWAHPRITVTPHVAADTRAETASRVIAENVRRGEAGEPFLHRVDRARGY